MPSCAKFKDELIACLELSDCVLIAKKTVKECTEKQYADLVSKECKLKQQAYFECRINMVFGFNSSCLPDYDSEATTAERVQLSKVRLKRKIYSSMKNISRRLSINLTCSLQHLSSVQQKVKDNERKETE